MWVRIPQGSPALEEDKVKRFQGKSSVNYVDKNDRYVGYEIEVCCCESFGEGIFSAPPDKVEFEENCLDDIDLDSYCFVDEPPVRILPSEHGEDNGGAIAWRIVSPTGKDLWITFWNYHNGYYAHGFISWNSDGAL